MAAAERKDERASNEDGNIHTDVNNGQSNCSESERGADVLKDSTSVSEDVSFVGHVTVTLANFPFVKVGHFGKISIQIESCRDQGKTPLKVSSISDDINSVPNDAYKLHSPRTSSIPAVPIVETRYNYDDAQTTRDNDVPAAGQTQKHVDRLVDVENPMPRIKKQGSLTGKRCETVMRTLEELQDAGRFETHEVLVCDLLEFFTKNNDPDMVASVKIERGVAHYYENDLRGSRKLYKDVIQMGESLQNRNLLQGRAYFLLATTYRRQTKFGTAIKYLQKAEQLLSHYEPGEDTAELFYNYAVEWLHFHWNNFADDKSRQVSKSRAKEYYELAIAHSAKDERPRVQLKKNILFNIRLAGLHLDCGTRAARETRQVTGEDIRKAKKLLDFVEHYLSNCISPSIEIKLLITRSDQYYREGKFFVAKETAQEALALAKRINMNMHIGPLNERIKERSNLLQIAPPLRDMSRFISDSGWSAGVSSCSA